MQSLGSDDTPLSASMANMLIQKLFGYGQVTLKSIKNKSISPEDIVIVDGQIKDITAQMVAYYKTKAPFKV